jgi:hypothetical protein
MKRTTKYNLGYFEQGDYISAIYEMQRWETLDAQLSGLFNVLGNGVIEGWDLLISSGLSIMVGPGSGHVNLVAVESTNSTEIANLLPNSTNYIYASLTLTSYWDKSVNFSALTSLDTTGELLYLGYAVTNIDSVITVNTDNRTNLGFVNTIRQLIKDHKHIGGTDNPPPVNLSTEVQGIINQNNLPDLDASKIMTGTIDEDRLPDINHITNLINQGTLTHAQLDSFVQALNITGNTLMGETSTVNLLQLLLALKHIYPDIDEYLVNEIAYIPGISPDNYVDNVNNHTTATVDILPSSQGGTHTITGASITGKNVYTKTWDTETEFETGTPSNVFIDGDSVELEAQENTLPFDNFTTSTGWQVITEDFSSVPSTITLDPINYVSTPPSGKITIGGQQVEVILSLTKTFDATDWSEYNYITFYLKTENVDHGDVYFYLKDVYSGTQDSYIKVLDRNAPTINMDTLQNGWQEVTVDISSYTRENINTIGLYVSTQKGWDTSKEFDLNIDKISLSTGNTYKEDGYLRLTYGGSFLYDFWRIRWDASIPTDIHSIGLVFKVRSRVGNTPFDLNQAIWSSYTNGITTNWSDIPLPSGSLYKYIEIEVYFGASTDLSRTAFLRRLYLDYYIADTENSFNYNSKDDWDSGDLFNVDTLSVPNSMLIAKTEEVNDIFYGTSGSAVQLDDNLNELYNITGSMLPKSTYQSLNGLSPSLGLVTGVSRGSQGNVWISDPKNNRIIEVDKAGSLLYGLYGSFLSPPNDPYGIEEFGPGSNEISTNTSTTTSTTTTLAVGETIDVLHGITTTTLAVGETIDVLHSIYNPDEGVLYIVFDKNLENIYDPATKLDLNKIYVKIGTQRFYLNDSTVELLGVPEEQYNNWYALSTSTDPNAEFISQFKFTSHVLKITLNGADKSLLNHMVYPEAPSIVIASPYAYQMVSSTVSFQFLLYNFVLGTGTGQNGIRIFIDGVFNQDIYSDKVTISGLIDGTHIIKAQLLTAGVLDTNIEAIAEGTFIVATTITQPYVFITTPKINQIYSSSPIVLEFEVENYSILPTDQHVRYQIDSEAPIDYYSTEPITINDITAGKHTITVYLVNKNGVSWGYPYGTAMANFIVGLNSNARTMLYVDKEAIYNITKSVTTTYNREYIDVANVYFGNIYSPIDVQIIPCETSKVNTSGLPTVLVAKLRSPSWLTGLGGEANLNAFVTAIQNEFTTTTTSTMSTLIPTTTTTTTTPTSLSTTTTTTTTAIPIKTSELIYGTKFLDGHSVVQFNLQGQTIFSNNAAVFANNKDEAETLLGSAQKIGDNELLIGDSVNKRAIITSTNLDTEKSQIIWQYNSDRFVSDFRLVLQDEKTIIIRDDCIDPSNISIVQNTIIIWKNNSISPVTVYSGKTTYDDFQLDQDLNLYGSEFRSQVLQSGESYAFKFVIVGEYDWFIHPNILTGKISVTKNRISPTDQFLILENDSLNSPFTSRVIKVDCWGNVLFSFGENYLVNPRDARPLLNGNTIIST